MRGRAPWYSTLRDGQADALSMSTRRAGRRYTCALIQRAGQRKQMLTDAAHCPSPGRSLQLTMQRMVSCRTLYASSTMEKPRQGFMPALLMTRRVRLQLRRRQGPNLSSNKEPTRRKQQLRQQHLPLDRSLPLVLEARQRAVEKSALPHRLGSRFGSFHRGHPHREAIGRPLRGKRV